MRSLAARMGESDQGGRSFDDALAEAQAINDRFGIANVIWKRAVTASQMATEDRDQMFADFDAAADAFEDMGARPMLARLLRDWGNTLRSADRTYEGDAKLREALRLFDEMDIEREANEVRELLSA